MRWALIFSLLAGCSFSSGNHEPRDGSVQADAMVNPDSDSPADTGTDSIHQDSTPVDTARLDAEQHDVLQSDILQQDAQQDTAPVEGQLGGACRLNFPMCNDGMGCRQPDDTCQLCGDLNAVCCDYTMNSTCPLEGTACDPFSHTCKDCGMNGSKCCNGSVCNPGLLCVSGFCHHN